MAAPTTTSPYGVSVDFTVPSGVASVAGTSTGKWANAGNLLAYDSSGNYVECSITYFASGGAQSQGWYFWWGYNGSGQYVSLSADPTSDSVTLTLLYNGTNWIAFLNDNTNSLNNHSKSFSTSIAGYVIASSTIMWENGGNGTCSNYSSWGSSMTFSNLTYYDSNDNTISFTNSINSLVNCNVPNTCSGGTACITENNSPTNLTISRNC